MTGGNEVVGRAGASATHGPEVAAPGGSSEVSRGADSVAMATSGRAEGVQETDRSSPHST